MEETQMLTIENARALVSGQEGKMIQEQQKVGTKKVKVSVLKAFYYEGQIQKKDSILEMALNDAKQWPSKVKIIIEDKSAPAPASQAAGKPGGDDTKKKEERKS
jgi:hypothetical protein